MVDNVNINPTPKNLNTRGARSKLLSHLTSPTNSATCNAFSIPITQKEKNSDLLMYNTQITKPRTPFALK